MAEALEIPSDEPLVLVAIHPDDVPDQAEQLTSYINRALSYAHDAVDATQLLDLAARKKALVLCVMVAKDTEKAECLSVGVVQLGERDFNDMTVRCLHVSTLAGQAMAEWLDSLWLPALRLLAIEQGCQFLSCSGRRGWKRILEGRGWHLWRDNGETVTMVGAVDEFQQK